MAGERTLPGLALTGFWTPGSDGWSAGLDDNLRRLSALVQCRVKSRTTALPGTPSLGDLYIVVSSDPTNPNKIAIWDGEVGSEAWVYVAPLEGFGAYVVDSATSVTFDGSAWVEVSSGMTGAEIVTALDSQLGSTAWQTQLTGAGIVAALDTQLGSAAWQTQLTGAGIVAALDTQLGSTTWQSGASALDLSLTKVTEAGLTRTLSAADFSATKVIVFTNGSPVTVTLPASLDATEPCTIIQHGAGQITIVPNGVTMNAPDAANKTRVQYSQAVLIPDPTAASNVFWLGGDVTA